MENNRAYYLAIDIGASSGRHILGCLSDGKLVIEEIYRFNNEAKKKDGHLVWDVDRICTEIINGLKKCKAQGKIPHSLGIDTWGVDYVLLDGNKQRLGPVYAYRDARTRDMDLAAEKFITPQELYQRTGLQKLPFNTVYQLLALKQQSPEILAAAEYFLMVPDYLAYLLTGELANEYTIASTTQLLDVNSRQWDKQLISRLQLPAEIFGSLRQPGCGLGKLQKRWEREIGFSCEVVLPASHDTGSAFMAVPTEGEDKVYLSSGTWSLMGCELSQPITTERARQLNYTNEGGYNNSYRFLRNIMGLWMLQSIRNQLPQRLSFPELSAAAAVSDIRSLVDCDDQRFLAPKDMIREIRAACQSSGQELPQTAGEIAAVIYNSLTTSYQKTFQELQELTGRKFAGCHIVGGGCQDRYLNQLTADRLQVVVDSGPIEATALGNIAAQMIKDQVFTDLAQARACIYRSFMAERFLPHRN